MNKITQIFSFFLVIFVSVFGNALEPKLQLDALQRNYEWFLEKVKNKESVISQF